MSNELAYYDALKRIAKNYQTPDQLRRNSERDFGCSYEEALEMAYENLQWEASRAIHGKRRPKATSSVSRPHGARKVCGYHDGCPPDGPVCHLCEHLQPGGGK